MAAAPLSQPSQALAEGSVLPGTSYRVVRLIGVGGMGEVYEAEHEGLGVRRALKVLAPHASGSERVARMRAEARALARLRHPNIVEVHDLGAASDGRSFLSMELLAGVTLRELLQPDQRLPAPCALTVVADLLAALQAAHGLDIVHRDVKPENIFVCDDGTVRLLDFGVAKFLATDQVFTQSGVAMGTPRYMAPEQIQGMPVDHRVDLYAVGVVLYEMLAGAPPFADDQLIALAYAHVMRPAPRLEGELPPALVAAVARSLEKSPADRFDTASAFAEVLAGSGLAAGPRRDLVDCVRRAKGADVSSPMARSVSQASPPAVELRSPGAVLSMIEPTLPGVAGITPGSAQRTPTPGPAEAVASAAGMAPSPAPAAPRRKRPALFVVVSALLAGGAFAWMGRGRHEGPPTLQIATMPTVTIPAAIPAVPSTGPVVMASSVPATLPVLSGAPVAAPAAPDAGAWVPSSPPARGPTRPPKPRETVEKPAPAPSVPRALRDDEPVILE